ncbi:MAG TPA: hypothetical protein VL125_17275 [Pelobium sp.]|nr:hypothetical protein [Pelobium sp.]
MEICGINVQLPCTKPTVLVYGQKIFVQRFKMYADSNYRPEKAGKTLRDTSMPWMMYAGMKTSDLEAIYAHLKSLKT